MSLADRAQNTHGLTRLALTKLLWATRGRCRQLVWAGRHVDVCHRLRWHRGTCKP